MAVDARVADLVGRGLGEEAATLVLESLGPEILGYLRAVLRDDADASDAFSLFSEGVWRGLLHFRGEASLRAWCYRIAYRAILSGKRDPFRRRRDRMDTTMASRVAGRIFASTALERERQSDALERLKATLEPDEQTLLTLRVDRQLSWREVADVLVDEGAERADEAALRKRFERLKEKLARAAREAGLVG